MKTLGIMGGMGPLAGVRFLELVIRMTAARSDNDHIPAILLNRPSIPDRTSYILGQSKTSPLPQLLAAARDLAGQGADLIALPCVTAHYFYTQLKQQIQIPILNLIDLTALELANNGVCRAGLMATTGTIAGGFFKSRLNDYNIELIGPDTAGQALISDVIYNGVKANRAVDWTVLEGVEKQLKDRGAQTIILGCTELATLAEDAGVASNYIDVLQVLARQAVLECCAKLNQSVISVSGKGE